MKVTHIPFQKTGFFSKTMQDYLEKKDTIQPFYNHYPDIEGMYFQMQEKQKSFLLQTRLTLVNALQKQYKSVKTSEKTSQNIALLQQQNTFTVTTGHQLNLFTGPLYFLYKIITTINLCKELTAKFPEQNFVPVYWMATEDHDFDEINFFNFKGKKVTWNSNQKGAVGRFSTASLDAVFQVFSNHLGNSKNADFLRQLFKNAYLKHANLADATRFIANSIFGDDGLLIIDGDDAALKKVFVPFIKDELQNKTSFKEVQNTTQKLEETYAVQVNPRELNLFYLGDDFRERIVFEDGLYKVINTKLSFTEDEILAELDINPKAFSPNVIMRPLYQEVILPNLCYIGGGGEMAYWLQLKAYFKAVSIPFPVLLLRNSVQIISQKQAKKLDKLSISKEEIFLNQQELLAKKVVENSDLDISLAERKVFLKQQFADLKEVAKRTDVTFINAVKAQEKKQLNGLEKLEKRLLKAEKRRQKDLVTRITALQNELLPNNALEERQRNFSEYYLAYGAHFTSALKTVLNPLQLKFTILEL